MGKSAYDRINESLQGQIYSVPGHGELRFLLYWQTIPDLVTKRSYDFRFLDLTSRPIVPVDYSPRDLLDIREIDISTLKALNLDVERDLLEFLQTARTSWPNDIGKLVIPKELDVKQ